jgi:hypothetical protein
MNGSARRVVLATLLALGLTVSVTPTVQAAVVPIDPGPRAEGRPIWGTTQNLPPMGVTGNYFAGPQNAAAIVEYYDSGQARRDQQSVATAARQWIYSWVDDRCGGKPQSCDATVVFDIDETLLSNYAYYKSTGFTFTQDGWNAFTESCGNTAIGPSRDLYRRLVRDGFAVVLLTGRSDTERATTAACLKERGISGWHELILRTQAEASLSADEFKSQRRADLQREGHRIVASIGDQVSDMSEGHLKAGFLLPNVMYFIP